MRLAADKIFVYGSFQCGTITDPFPGSLKITLHGVPPASEVAANATGGNKALVVLGSGILMIHGGKRSTWTRIATTAYAGDQSIQVTKLLIFYLVRETNYIIDDCPCRLASRRLNRDCKHRHTKLHRRQ